MHINPLNFPPGTCSISPPIGLATVTNFNFTCKNWDDPDGPIKFSFSYEINGVRSVFLDHTVNPGESFVLISDLPIGNSKRDNLLDVYVVIEDKYGGATEVHRPVTVDRVHCMILYDNESSFWMFTGREVCHYSTHAQIGSSVVEENVFAVFCLVYPNLFMREQRGVEHVSHRGKNSFTKYVT